MSPPIEPMRIVQALESSGPGGAENIVFQLCCSLRDRGHRVSLATMREGWMTERAEAAGIDTWIVPQEQGIDLGWIRRFANRLRQEKVEFLHTHEFAMNTFGGIASRLARVPAASTIHGKNWVADRRRRGYAYRLLARAGVPVIAVSRDLANFLATRLDFPERSIHVIHNGISVDNPPASSARRHDARAAAGLPVEGRLCVAVGNLYPVKDHATLLRAAAGIHDLQIAIAGRGQEEANLRKLACDLGMDDRVHLLGLRNDIDRLLEAADLFAQPSLSEGLPLSILEAMAAGLPVVASDVGGVGEAIESGTSGLLISPGDVAALEDALRRLGRDPEACRALGAAARTRVVQEFSIATMTDRHERLYESLRR